MLFGEWNWDTAKSVWQEEAREDGIAIGRGEGIAIGEARGKEEGHNEVFALLERGVPLAEAKRMLGLK